MKPFTKVLAALACLVMLTVSSVADAADRRIWLVNNTSFTITRFFASNVERDSWENDILGSDVLPSGRRVRVNVDDGSGQCYFDLKVVFNDGTTNIKRGFNVCARESWTLND